MFCLPFKNLKMSVCSSPFLQFTVLKLFDLQHKLSILYVRGWVVNNNLRCLKTQSQFYLFPVFLFYPPHSHRFDTYRSKDESRRLAKYVDGVGAGLILALMVNDEGSNNLEDSAKKILFRLGSQHINTLGFRWAFQILFLNFRILASGVLGWKLLRFSETKTKEMFTDKI